MCTTLQYSYTFLFLGDAYMKNKLRKLFLSQFPAFKLRIGLKPGNKIGSFFSFKDIPFRARSYIVYKFSCSNRNITYIKKTTWHLLVRLSEHLDISHITWERDKI